MRARASGCGAVHFFFGRQGPQLGGFTLCFFEEAFFGEQSVFFGRAATRC